MFKYKIIDFLIYIAIIVVVIKEIIKKHKQRKNKKKEAATDKEYVKHMKMVKTLSSFMYNKILPEKRDEPPEDKPKKDMFAFLKSKKFFVFITITVASAIIAFLLSFFH